jgi:hypothetical protein
MVVSVTITLKNSAENTYYATDGALEKLTETHGSDQTFTKSIVVLMRNTTWRCGKLERSIIRHLHKRHENFGNSETSIKDMMNHLNLTAEKRNEFLDALRRLEKRNIVRLSP